MQPARPKSTNHGRRVVLVTFGSWGDVLPYVAIALGLRQRGHRVVMMTSDCYRTRVEATGLDFHAVRPGSEWVADPSLMRHRSHRALGLIRVAREWVLPALRETYEDVRSATTGADLLLSHPLAAYAVRLVAEKHRIDWISTMLVPLGFFSAYDRVQLPLPFMLTAPLRCLGPRGRKLVLGFGKRVTRFLAEPWYRLREELNLPSATDLNPLGESHSPDLVLALFSQMLSRAQPDWPPQTVLTGFPVLLRPDEPGLSPELSRFLDSGSPPLVFTLGTAVGSDAGQFFEISGAAARAIGHRAVLVGSGATISRAGPEAIALDHAPFAQLFSRAAAVVHHGGIGTTGLAMQSGRPMLVVPRAWDQPDNAARVTRLGVARVLSPGQYTTSRLTVELRCLLCDEYRQRSNEIANQMKLEDGVRSACDAMERFLR